MRKKRGKIKGNKDKRNRKEIDKKNRKKKKELEEATVYNCCPQTNSLFILF